MIRKENVKRKEKFQLPALKVVIITDSTFCKQLNLKVRHPQASLSPVHRHIWYPDLKF